MDEDKVKVSCAACGTTNFFPVEAKGKAVVCGRCKARLPEPGQVLEPTAEGLAGLFQNSSLPVLLDFYSTTCAPCHMMRPVLERLAARRAGQVAVAKVNVESHPEVARDFGVQAVPTFVVVFKGTERGRTAGATDESSFSLWVAGRT
jgi:thioredoxin 2